MYHACLLHDLGKREFTSACCRRWAVLSTLHELGGQASKKTCSKGRQTPPAPPKKHPTPLLVLRCCRETWIPIKSSGFSSCDITHFDAVNNPVFTLLSPHIVGRAVK